MKGDNSMISNELNLMIVNNSTTEQSSFVNLKTEPAAIDSDFNTTKDDNNNNNNNLVDDDYGDDPDHINIDSNETNSNTSAILLATKPQDSSDTNFSRNNDVESDTNLIINKEAEQSQSGAGNAVMWPSTNADAVMWPSSNANADAVIWPSQ